MGSWTTDIISSMGYWGIVLLMFVENVFPPIPSEVIMPLAGYMVTLGQLSLGWIITAGTIGSVLGALPLYYLGKKVGDERLKDFVDNHGRWLGLSRRDIEGASNWFDKYGGMAVFFCRLVPGIRSLISIPAGLHNMNMASFMIYTTMGSAIWTALLAYLGYILGSSFRTIGNYLDPASTIIFAILIVLYLVRVFRHKRRADSDDS